jgi:hypothetical protein
MGANEAEVAGVTGVALLFTIRERPARDIHIFEQDTAATVRRSLTQGAQLIRVSKKSATDRHGIPPKRPMRRSTSTPQHLLILVITLYARSGRRGRGFESRHPDSKAPGQRRFMIES